MKYYLAPLEGITTYIYRRAYHTHYRPMEKYFTPFLVPHTKKDFNTREKNDILPAHNPGMNLVPQILTNDAKGFLDTVEKLKGYGYDEVNLNLGCPSKTVVSKGRGSGFLIHTEELNRFLDEIYAKADVKISIKTRIGKFDADEWGELLRIYNQYPLEELIVHPRVQQQFYKGHPDLDAFADAVKECKHTLCYNGDIFTTEDMEKLKKRFPEASCIMLGRGILRNPELIEIMKTGEKKIDAKKLRAFHDQIYQDYQEGAAKMELCMELLNNAVNGGHKVLLFSQFTSMLGILEKRMEEAGIGYYSLTGSTPKKERMELMEKFNRDATPVFCISLKAGGTGLNLTGADVVIHYDPWWNVAAENQATDRAHRIGQKRVVTVYKLVAEHTIEEKVVELQQKKKELADQVLSGEEMGSILFDREELLKLFQN